MPTVALCAKWSFILDFLNCVLFDMNKCFMFSFVG